jgi:hypothetical protein
MLLSQLIRSNFFLFFGGQAAANTEFYTRYDPLPGIKVFFFFNLVMRVKRATDGMRRTDACKETLVMHVKRATDAMTY